MQNQKYLSSTQLSQAAADSIELISYRNISFSVCFLRRRSGEKKKRAGMVSVIKGVAEAVLYCEGYSFLSSQQMSSFLVYRVVSIRFGGCFVQSIEKEEEEVFASGRAEEQVVV